MSTLFHSAAATLLLLLRALRTRRLGPDHRLLCLTHRPLGRLLPTAWFLRRSHLLLLLLLLRKHFLSLPDWSGGHKGVQGQIEPPENTCRVWVNHSGRPPQDHAHCGRGHAVSSAPTRNMAGSPSARFFLSRGSFASKGGGIPPPFSRTSLICPTPVIAGGCLSAMVEPREWESPRP